MKTAEYSDRFCITAYGAITPIGNTIEEIFESLRNGKSGMHEIEKFDHRAFKTSKAGVPAEGNFAIHSHKKIVSEMAIFFMAKLWLSAWLNSSILAQYIIQMKSGAWWALKTQLWI